MLIYFKSLIFIVIEMFCYKLFFEIFTVPKNYKYKIINTLLFSLLILSDFILVVYLSNDFILKQLAVILVFCFYMLLLFEVTFFKSLALSIMFQGLLLITDYLFWLILSSLKINGISSSNLMDKDDLIVLLGKATLLVFVLILNQYFNGKKKLNIDVSKKDWILILPFPLMTIGVITALIIHFINSSSEQTNTLFIIASSLVFMNIIEFYLIKNILVREKQIRENELFKLQTANQVQMYHSISSNLDILRRKTHEYQNQITCFGRLIYDEKYTEAKSYLEKISTETAEYYDHIDTNNVIVNAILNTKYREAREENILFVFKFNDLAELKIEDTDIVILLSNLINNAIEATTKCLSNRIIKIKLEIEGTDTIIAVSNFHENKLIEKGNTFATTKPTAPDNHGIGLRNIIDVVKKYHGSYAIRTVDNEFLFSSIIPNTPLQ